MGCLFVVLAALSPRLALALVWLFTNLVDRAFNGALVPVLGFVFLPLTTLFYVLAYNPVGGVTGVGWLLVAIGLLFDIGAYGGAVRQRSRG
jgi:hypothetical protein